MKLVFFGTSKFAVPALKKLADSDYEIAAVITQPDKPAGRKQELSPSPVKEAAQELGLKILQPSKLDSKFEIPDSDIFIVASYGKIIPKSILAIPKYGTLNIHPSLLPKYRGPSPIQSAILNGDKETGVSIMVLDAEMDHGPVLANVKAQISNNKGFRELHDGLAVTGAELLMEVLAKYINGEIKPQPQDHSQVTFTKIITKDDGRIDWNKPAEVINNLIRAYEDWPVAWTTLDGKRLKIFEAEVVSETGKQGELKMKNSSLIIFASSSALEIKILQLEGGKK